MNNKKQFWTVMFLVVSVALLVASHTGLDAREFRGLLKIDRGIEKKMKGMIKQSGCVEVGSIVAIPRETVMSAMDALAAAWNGTGLSGLLSDEFASKEQLLQAMTDEVPRDAILTILSVQSAQTLQQCEITLDTVGKNRLSIVAVVARTQIEFTDPDPAIGFQSLEATNEYYFRFTQKIKQILVQVPNVTGKPKGVASAELTSTGLRSKFFDIATTDPKKDGIVDTQLPEVGEFVAPDTEVQLEVGKYTAIVIRRIMVPNVKGMFKSEAVAKLTSAGLKSKVVDIPTEDPKKDGIVYTQLPDEGEFVAPDTEVQLEVGKNKAPIVILIMVPNVKGMLKSEAVGKLTSAGLKSKVVDLASAFLWEDGIVGAQSPEADEFVASASEVQLKVGKYKAPPGYMPLVVGMDVNQAFSLLGSRGYRVRVIGQVSTTDQSQNDKVANQMPRAGTYWPTFKEVQMVVWAYKAEAPQAQVPDVMGMALAIAKQKLKEKEFVNVVVEEKFTTDITKASLEEPKVYSQNPAAYSLEKIDKRILLAVWTYVADKRFEVPRVKGLKLEEAKRILKAAKLNYEIRWDTVTDQRRHLLVDRQSPRPNTQMRSMVSPGSVVYLEVLEYIPAVKVPNVVGMKWKDAVKKLKDAGLPNYSLNYTSYYWFNRNPEVVKQGTAPGRYVHPRKTIALHIPMFIIEPPYISEGGMLLEDLRSNLWEQGWRGNIKIDGHTNTFIKERLGKVSGYFKTFLNDETPRDVVHNENVPVKVYIWGMNTVPRLVGYTLEKAIETLSSRGFKFQTSWRKHSDESKDCTVKETDPKQGTLLKGGSVVKLTVYRRLNKATLLEMGTGEYKDLDPCPGE